MYIIKHNNIQIKIFINENIANYLEEFFIIQCVMHIIMINGGIKEIR